MNIKEYIKQDAVGLSDLVKRKEISPSELIDLSEARLDQVKDDLNPVASSRIDQAREEVTNNINLSSPFSGVPFYLKGISQGLKGEPLEGGAKLLKGLVAKQTSYLAQDMLDTGLVCLGHSTTPEFALKNITESELFGPTRNPWHHDYSPGGSSGGASALVASGVVPLAGASDGGGSIRIPASFTSLVGLKPTRGRTSVGPGVGRQWHGAAIDFALTKSVRDSARLLDNLQVVQEAAAFQTPLYTYAYEVEIERECDWKLSIAYTTESPVATPVTDEAKEAVLNVVKWFEAQGHSVTETDNGIDGKEMMRNYYLMNSGEVSATIKNIEKQMNQNITEKDLEIEAWLLNVAGKSVSAADFSLSLASWDQAAEKMSQFHQTYDFYITPAAASTAPKVGELTQSKENSEKLHEAIMQAKPNKQQEIIYEMFLPSLTYTPFTQLANLTGQPAISVPTHRAQNGLPIGVQIMAKKGADHSLLKIARQLEKSSLWVGVKDLLG